MWSIGYNMLDINAETARNTSQMSKKSPKGKIVLCNIKYLIKTRVSLWGRRRKISTRLLENYKFGPSQLVGNVFRMDNAAREYKPRLVGLLHLNLFNVGDALGKQPVCSLKRNEKFSIVLSFVTSTHKWMFGFVRQGSQLGN